MLFFYMSGDDRADRRGIGTDWVCGKIVVCKGKCPCPTASAGLEKTTFGTLTFVIFYITDLVKEIRLFPDLSKIAAIVNQIAGRYWQEAAGLNIALITDKCKIAAGRQP